ASFPTNMRTVTYRRPSWSDDGKTILVGIAAWEAKPPAPPRGRGANAATDDESAGRGGRGGRGGNAGANGQERDEPAAVDVWHWKDPIVMAQQKLSAAADRRRNLLSAWHLDTGRFVQIGKTQQETITPIAGWSAALVDDWSAYAMERSIGRPAGDLHLVDLASGSRTRIKERVTGRSASVSPGGRFVLFVEGGHYMTIDTGTRAIANLTKSIATSFVDVESDQTSAEKPMFGVGGWTKDDAAVLLYDKFDIWLVPTDGAKPSRLTSGAADQVRHRYLRINPDAEFVDVASPSYVSLFGIWSKQSGYGILKTSGSAASGMTGTVDRAVWMDKSVTGLSKATGADVFAYTVQAHDDSPDLFLTTAALNSPRQITTTNPFQSKFAWSRSELVEYKSEKGLRLEGALYYPAGYQPGRTYPMIVYVYETLSDGVHRYVAPSDRDYYNTTVFTSQGYFVLQPDIIFRPREPGLSVVECVRPAVKAVVDKGLVDPKRVGMVGHSWGGFDTAYMAANTTTFAAAVAGAAITDLVSNYGNHHWSSGIAETDHIETGQQRMVVPLYEDLQAYIRNSAIYNVPKMTTPLLLMTGDNDGTVHWHQAVAMYNIARRAGKNVVMIVYNGEDHGLRQAKNQVDYQQRILAWFGHYLKGDPAASWITDGQSFLAREAEVKKAGGR
ncbi:MAG TPA: prolyl oligopeptidase family serine peptidase, partial [Vicinamibacterales bacterium]|nr:prolyl oligopeptidase family serine peptidase [Vicinamibacterales bacterium]